MKANVVEVKARLSEFLARIEQGETVIICRRNRPIAELRPVTRARIEPRPIGGARGQLVVPDAFFEPLPADVLSAFEGGLASDTTPHAISVARETPAPAVPARGRSPRPAPRARRRKPGR